MKKLFKIFLLLISLFLIASCEFEQTEKDYVILPNLSNLSRAEIEAKLKNKDVEYQFYTTPMQYSSSSEYDRFVEYGNGLKSGDKVPLGTYLRIYTTALFLPKENIVDVEMDFEYEGKDFLTDGVGEVTLARAIDGDTAHFYTKNGTYIKVRFLGIDTPESTIESEAWGKAASTFTRNILQNAKTIVLEAEGNTTDAYGRYLAFVWADGVLVNLQIIQNAYSDSKLGATSKYFDAFYDTEFAISQTGRRYWGEIDPDYDYVNHEFK